MENKKSLKNRVIVFVIFFIILNIVIFYFTYQLLNMPNTLGYASNVNVDNADFTPITNSIIAGFNGIIFLVTSAFIFIINILLIVISTTIFSKMYFNTLCNQMDTFVHYIKIAIWSISIFGILINIFLNMDYKLIDIIITTIFIYLPLPIIVYVIFFSKLNKIYSVKNLKIQ